MCGETWSSARRWLRLGYGRDQAAAAGGRGERRAVHGRDLRAGLAALCGHVGIDGAGAARRGPDPGRSGGHIPCGVRDRHLHRPARAGHPPGRGPGRGRHVHGQGRRQPAGRHPPGRAKTGDRAGPPDRAEHRLARRPGPHAPVQGRRRRADPRTRLATPAAAADRRARRPCRGRGDGADDRSEFTRCGITPGGPFRCPYPRRESSGVHPRRPTFWPSPRRRWWCAGAPGGRRPSRSPPAPPWCGRNRARSRPSGRWSPPSGCRRCRWRRR